MSGPARLVAQARAGLRQAVGWIARDNAATVARLVEAVRAAARAIGENPMMGAPRPKLLPEHGRMFVLSRWPYLLIYADDTEPPAILRVLHAARDLDPLLATLPEP